MAMGNGGRTSKLLGTPFGLNLKTLDVDQFLYGKITKKQNIGVL